MNARHVHVDPTSFTVSGEYPREELGEDEASVIAITYGYSRDHREDLKQWMLALATTQEGDVPLFLRPLDGNSSDEVTLASTVEVLHEQLDTPDSELSFFVADSGIYSEANMRATMRPRSAGSAGFPKPAKRPKPWWKRQSTTRSGKIPKMGDRIGSHKRCHCRKEKSAGW